ncbi:MAG: helix-turn-helix domain-containing protein [Spirosomataceae bacterium]
MPPILSPKIDIYALWMFLGIIQAFFLAYFFIFNKQGNTLANRYLGILLIVFGLCLTEILLCYTNYMFSVIHLIDFSEAGNFLFAPLIYLYHRYYLGKSFSKKDYWHFAPFVIYLIYLFATFYLRDYPVKYNAYLNAYHDGGNHPELKLLPAEYNLPAYVYRIRGFVNEMMLVQMFIYIVAGFMALASEARAEKMPFWSNQNPAFVWCRRGQIYSLAAVVVFILVKLLHHNDLGDHFIAAYLTLIIYALSFTLMSQSTFLHQKNVKKYEKSSLTNEIQENTLAKLQNLMDTEKPFLNPNFSLPNLSKRLSVSPHHLSQILNESLGQSFFDFTAQYRIEEAKRILKNPETQSIKIEEIAEMVGYNSKSAFNTAFKKLTGKTPSEFRNA